MINIWPSSDLFELMEGLKIIEMHAEGFRLSPSFIDFIEVLDSKKVNWAVEDMVKKGILPEPETEDARRVYFYMVVVALWDSSLPADETQTAALFLSAMSWAMGRGIL